jgi:predicted enzyme related to lactoylglutathione lyase
MPDPAPRLIPWTDLTIPDAAPVRDFYAAVLGCDIAPTDMGGYDDYTLVDPATGLPIGGVCHARGPNAGLPPVWLPYFRVDDLDAALAATTERGGRLLHGPRDMGPHGRMAVVADPAGAACALMQPPADQGTGA